MAHSGQGKLAGSGDATAISPPVDSMACIHNCLPHRPTKRRTARCGSIGAIRFALGRELADAVPDATFEPLEGSAHFPWYGDADGVADRILHFLGVDLPDVRLDVGTVPGTEGIALLTTREREIMALIAEGLTDPQIAGRLHVSTHTVHRHVANVRTKLGVGSRAAAAARIAAVGE
jgi:DNA-binding CsgD family transcriptional regulator